MQPSALSQQQRLLAGQSRFPSAKNKDDDTSSVMSWNTVQSAADPETDDDLALPPADLKFSKMDPINENVPSSDRGQASQQSSAPATQAARNFVEHANETPADRRLRKQQEQARKKGRRGVRWVQLPCRGGGAQYLVSIPGKPEAPYIHINPRTLFIDIQHISTPT